MLNLRPFPSLIFAIALLFAQQGGALHTLRHAFAKQTHTKNNQAPFTHDCEECTTYAQLGNALNSEFFSFDFCTSLAQTFTPKHQLILSQHTLTAIARGPPDLQSLL